MMGQVHDSHVHSTEILDSSPPHIGMKQEEKRKKENDLGTRNDDNIPLRTKHSHENPIYETN